MTYRVRWGFLLALGSTAALSASDFWMRAGNTASIEAQTPQAQQQSPAATSESPQSPRPAAAAVARSLSVAAADPFEVAPPPPPPPPKQPVVAPAPPPPAPPPMNWRYFGQMTSPDNKRQVYLSRGDQAIAIEAGQRLDDGFLVDAVTAENVRLRHVDSGFQFLIALPESPPQASQ